MPKTLHLRSDRFRTLWTVLKWEGGFRNNQVQTLFGLSPGQASRLIAEFRAAFPAAVELESRTKTWVMPKSKAPGDLKDPKEPKEAKERREADLQGGEIAEYLGLLGRIRSETPIWYQNARPDFLPPSADKFRIIRSACETGAGVSLVYSSLTQGPRDRVIYPHAIVELSQRWHVRAWCVTSKQYRDFNFGRMSEVRPSAMRRPDMPGDDTWNTFVALRVKPHRDLNAAQIETVRHEFCGGAMARRISVRAALAPYVLNELRIATKPTTQRPKEYLLELINKDVDRFLFQDGEPG
jgi:hypothetical protein